jgi:hypothetical protein
VTDAHHSKGHRKASPKPRNRIPWYRATLSVVSSRDRSAGRLESKPYSEHRTDGRTKLTRLVVIGAAIITAAAIGLMSSLHGKSNDPAADPSAVAHAKPGSFLGVFARGVPQSYAGIRAFTAATRVRPKLVVYYSGWEEPFQSRFAAVAARHDAMPLVQIDPTGISLTAIASGRYDAYLRSYASTVKVFGRKVVLSFAPEMNGIWYSWSSGHTSPAVYVAAWRHIVTVFRAMGVRNVIWLWTINVNRCRCHIQPPGRWWPGNSYVTWVGIDGYYYQSSWKFASLFGPTITAVRALTLHPILISETAAPSATQPVKIPNLFAGVRAYGLLGFVWFDANKGPYQDWRISRPEALAAFRRGAELLKGSEP